MVELEGREMVFGVDATILAQMPTSMQIMLKSMGVTMVPLSDNMTAGELVTALRAKGSSSAEFFILGKQAMFEQAGMVEALAGLQNVTMMGVRDNINWATALGCFFEKTAYCEMYANQNQMKKLRAMKDMNIDNVTVVDVSGHTDDAFLSDLEADLAY